MSGKKRSAIAPTFAEKGLPTDEAYTPTPTAMPSARWVPFVRASRIDVE